MIGMFKRTTIILVRVKDIENPRDNTSDATVLEMAFCSESTALSFIVMAIRVTIIRIHPCSPFPEVNIEKNAVLLSVFIPAQAAKKARIPNVKTTTKVKKAPSHPPVIRAFSSAAALDLCLLLSFIIYQNASENREDDVNANPRVIIELQPFSLSARCGGRSGKGPGLKVQATYIITINSNAMINID